MIKPALAAGSAVALLLIVVSAAAQMSAQLPIASVTCADLSSASAPYQAALVYYAAGYRDGVDYAMTLANTAGVQPPASALASAQTSAIAPLSSGPSAVATASSASAPAPQGSAAVVGGLTLQAADVIKACAQSPNALLTDIIANRGGGRGLVGATPAPTGLTATSAAQPAPTGTTGMSIAPETVPSNGGTTAVSNDLQGASQQLQQNVASSAIAPVSIAPTPAQTTPAPGASSP